MKKQDILKELQAIKSLMDENIVGAWNESLSDTTDAVVLDTMKSDKFGNEVQIKYNGWSERLDALTKALEETETSKLHDMVVKAGEVLSNDSSISYKELEKEVIRLTELKDVHVSLDHTLSDDFCPTEDNEHHFTVGTFLTEIGYVAD